MRWLLWIVGGILLGGIVHFGVVLALPRTASQDAFLRLQAVTPVNQVVPLPQPTAEQAVMPLMDPSFAMAVCRYDLDAGPIKLTAPISQAYTSVSFYTRQDIAYYAIGDRSAGKQRFELNLMTAEQKAQLPEDEEVTAADRLIITSPTQQGLIVLRALAPEPGLLPMAHAALAQAKCEVQAGN
jgi:uncharacterized membrane protein